MKKFLIIFYCSRFKSEYVTTIYADSKDKALNSFHATPHKNCDGKHTVVRIMEFKD